MDKKPWPNGNVVEEFNLGNTKIYICDDYCRDKTVEDAKATMKRLAEIARRGYINQYMEELEKQRNKTL